MSIQIYTGLTSGLANAAAEGQTLEALGFDGVSTDETAHDPFLPLAIVAQHTKTLRLRTGIAIAFARSPMTLANLAHDLNSFSGGRFTLGLGSQIKPHITRRFSMPWSSPAARMREMVEAIRAIFANWYDGETLNFEGKFYTHTLMTPMFTPTDTEHGKPPIAVAAVGPLMTEAVGAVADGMFAHSFTTEAYLRQHTLPRLHAGLASTGRNPQDCRVSLGPFIVTGTTEEAFKKSRRTAADRIAFYGSTPAYRPVLELHGWGELQTELHKMTREGRWREMGALIDDEVLNTFAVVGEVKDIAPGIWRRYGDIIEDFSIGRVADVETVAEIAADLRALAAAPTPAQSRAT
ncbi:MAG TPA: TIGR03617 family F420-dependent LLM class oxidoreductase [Caulobacteraceae bacterium]|nr:TIGR03617 family F420-dependent LLM class oxidoreductase [Caulobacteraceae bacterium]